MIKNLIVTVTNSEYFNSLLTLISSLHEHSFELIDEIRVFDLGLQENEITFLKKVKKVVVVGFTDDEKKNHPNFMVPKWHVYKLTCLHNCLDVAENVLWLDSGVCVLKDIKIIFDKIEHDDVFVVIDTHLTKTYTHMNCQTIMNASEKELNSNIISSGIFGFKSKGRYKNMINDSYNYSLIEGCCDGDNENHRHDQSILSILVNRYNCPTNDIEIYGYWTDHVRNINTAKEKNAVIFVHRRGYENTSKIKFISNETNNTGRIKIIDDNLGSQKGLSKYIPSESGWIYNNEPVESEIVIFTDRLGFVKEIDQSKSNFAWIIEPPIINGENYLYAVRDAHKFEKIFSYNLDLSKNIDNFFFIPHGGSWLREEDINIFNKSKNISFIFSDKQWVIGHKLRHKIYETLKEKNTGIEFFGTGCGKLLENKIDGLLKFRFSIVLENSITDIYFTEKILDCFLTGTIPIYWGTSKIVDFFDPDGIIFFPEMNEWGFDFEKLNQLLLTLTEELYLSKIPSIEKNFELAKHYIHPEKIINEYFKQNS